MNISDKIRKFQDGGATPSSGAPDPSQGGQPQGGDPSQGGQDPIMQLVQLAQQALQSQDCNAAMQVCNGLLSVLQQAQQQGGQGGSPDQSGGGAPPAQGAPQGQPVFKRGGRLVRRINN